MVGSQCEHSSDVDNSASLCGCMVCLLNGVSSSTQGCCRARMLRTHVLVWILWYYFINFYCYNLSEWNGCGFLYSAKTFDIVFIYHVEELGLGTEGEL